MAPGELGGRGRSRCLRVRIQGTAGDPGGVSAHGYLEGCERSTSPGQPAEAPHAAQGLGTTGTRGIAASRPRRVPGCKAGCLAFCGGPRTGTRAVGAREACELHLNGRPAHRAWRAGVWKASAGRATGGARRQRGRAPAFCNLLRLLPRLAPGSRLPGKGVTGGGVRDGESRQ